jgi:hypothetical protein
MDGPVIQPGIRVCPRCGASAAEHDFCPKCGFHLAAQTELPTRREWEEWKASQASTPPPQLPPAGWYADPQGSDGQRYWDGQAWSEQIRSQHVARTTTTAAPLVERDVIKSAAVERSRRWPPKSSIQNPASVIKEPASVRAKWRSLPLRGRLVAAASVAALILVAVVVAASGGGASGPADGTSCIGMSNSAIGAWVHAHASYVPSGLTQDEVTNEVSTLCTAAAAANLPQPLGPSLFETAVQGLGAP